MITYQDKAFCPPCADQEKQRQVRRAEAKAQTPQPATPVLTPTKAAVVPAASPSAQIRHDPVFEMEVAETELTEEEKKTQAEFLEKERKERMELLKKTKSFDDSHSV